MNRLASDYRRARSISEDLAASRMQMPAELRVVTSLLQKQLAAINLLDVPKLGDLTARAKHDDALFAVLASKVVNKAFTDEELEHINAAVVKKHFSKLLKLKDAHPFCVHVLTDGDAMLKKAAILNIKQEKTVITLDFAKLLLKSLGTNADPHVFALVVSYLRRDLGVLLSRQYDLKQLLRSSRHIPNFSRAVVRLIREQFDVKAPDGYILGLASIIVCAPHLVDDIMHVLADNANAIVAFPKVLAAIYASCAAAKASCRALHRELASIFLEGLFKKRLQEVFEFVIANDHLADNMLSKTMMKDMRAFLSLFDTEKRRSYLATCLVEKWRFRPGNAEITSNWILSAKVKLKKQPKLLKWAKEVNESKGEKYSNWTSQA